MMYVRYASRLLQLQPGRLQYLTPLEALVYHTVLLSYIVLRDYRLSLIALRHGNYVDTKDSSACILKAFLFPQ